MAEGSISISIRQARRGKIELAPQAQLGEARDTNDDWTGKTDAKERRKAQNRLHQRAWRRRKADAKSMMVKGHDDVGCSQPEHESITLAFQQATAALVNRPSETREVASVRRCTGRVEWTEWSEDTSSTATTSPFQPLSTNMHSATPLNIRDLMSINLRSTPTAPSSITTDPNPITITTTKSPKRPKLIPPLIPYFQPGTSSSYPPFVITFPLSPDHHLITLIQYNVFRGIHTNIILCRIYSAIPSECNLSLTISSLPIPSTPPPTFLPTPTQLVVPHANWIDSIPCARLRDNLIHAQGSYDEDELCEDVCGGLYEGFDDCRQRGLLVWSEPWMVESWEVSEGFAAKWGWLLEGCEEMWRSTDHWRRERGEEALGRVWEVGQGGDVARWEW
ncbi:hypothetical protein K505DRAFT_370407 [Melanomma pulvis-pyrius CBS 109.77]|uniref:BZIP domain-containing protein n=1 Tax=Melanomma pulvis-pyrius CBS 109.77 TaxID=1314802 RepID=A0A6A6XUF3_9PLEO|nr:hypothetical protein K505DRAFT_370407 [Melanomma pulvis-pyrius CBS 109.77]